MGRLRRDLRCVFGRRSGYGGADDLVLVQSPRQGGDEETGLEKEADMLSRILGSFSWNASLRDCIPSHA